MFMIGLLGTGVLGLGSGGNNYFNTFPLVDNSMV